MEYAETIESKESELNLEDIEERSAVFSQTFFVGNGAAAVREVFFVDRRYFKEANAGVGKRSTYVSFILLSSIVLL